MILRMRQSEGGAVTAKGKRKGNEGSKNSPGAKSTLFCVSPAIPGVCGILGDLDPRT